MKKGLFLFLFLGCLFIYFICNENNILDIKNEQKNMILFTQDDSVEIQKAIDRNVGGKVVFVKKVYVISKTITIPSNIEVDFNNSVIKRKTGSTAFDMIVNDNPSKGNKNIIIKNLIIDGNKDADGFKATSVIQRFSGLKLQNVTNSKLYNITVEKTVNGENQGNHKSKRPAAGIYFVNSTNINCININGYNNDRTAIFINKSKVKISNSLTYNNLGSGISSDSADNSEYYHITSYNNGYSNISINGKNSRVAHVLTFDSKYSGLNIGHRESPSDYTIVSDIKSYGNIYEGLTIGGSANVNAQGIKVYNNYRNNIRIFDGSTASKIQDVVAITSINGAGIRYDSGENHQIDYAMISNNPLGPIKVSPGIIIHQGAKVITH